MDINLTWWLAYFGITPSFSNELIVLLALILLAFFLYKAAKNIFTGQKVPVIKPIPAGGEGKIQFRSKELIAFSDSSQTIPEGTVVQIEKIEGIGFNRVKVKRLE